MTKRIYQKVDPLNRLIGVRVSTPFYDKLEGLRMQSNCQTLGEFARMVLQREEIIWYHKDATMDAIAAELAGIKKELNAIGTNINQVARYFNSTTLPDLKMLEARKVLAECKSVSAKIDDVLTIISDISNKWSPK